jgi:hypothetical protein
VLLKLKGYSYWKRIELSRLTRILTVVALLAIGGAIFSFWLKSMADMEKLRASKAEQTANEQKAEAEKQTKIAQQQRAEADKQRHDVIIARDDLEARNRELASASILEETARSDRLVAEEHFQRGEDAEALAHLARACRYVPKSSLPAEAALPAVLSPPITHALATFEGHTGAIFSAVFRPDGRRVLSASDDNTARLAAETGRAL